MPASHPIGPAADTATPCNPPRTVDKPGAFRRPSPRCAPSALPYPLAVPLPWPVYALTDSGVVGSSDGPPFGLALAANPLGESPLHIPDPLPGGRVIVPSGWFGPPGTDTAEPTPDPRTWSGEGLLTLEAWCARTAPSLEARSIEVSFRPHAAQILSDPRSCVTFLSRLRSSVFSIILDPAGFLTLDMLPRAPEHLTRAFEALASGPRISALALTNLELGPPGPHAARSLRPAPIDRGLLPADMLAGLAHQFWPRGRPILLVDPAADATTLARAGRTARLNATLA